MRIGVSSSGRWWISMGPLGWLLTIWVIAPFWLAWHLLVALVWVIVWACQLIAAWLQARR